MAAQELSTTAAGERALPLVFDDQHTATITFSHQTGEGTLLILPTQGVTLQLAVESDTRGQLIAVESPSTLHNVLFIEPEDCTNCTVTIKRTPSSSTMASPSFTIVVRHFQTAEKNRIHAEKVLQKVSRQFATLKANAGLRRAFTNAVNTLEKSQPSNSTDILRACDYRLTSSTYNDSKEKMLLTNQHCIDIASEINAWQFRSYLEVDNIKLGLWHKDEEAKALAALTNQLDQISQFLKTDNRTTARYLLGRNLLTTGMIYSKLGQYAKATSKLQQAKNIFAQIGNDYNSAEAELELGTVLRYQNQHHQAAKHFENASRINQASVLADDYQKTRIQYNMATISLLNGQYYLALKLLDSIDSSQFSDISPWPAHFKALKARVFLELHRLKEAEKLYVETWKMYETIGATSHLATLANNLSKLYTAKGNIEQSKHYTQQAITLAGNSWGLDQNIRIHQAQVNHHIQRQEYDLALTELANLEDQLQATDDHYRLGRVLAQKGETLLLQAKYQDAIAALNHAKDMHTIAGDHLFESKSDFMIGKAYFLDNRPSDEILPHLESAIATIESIRSTFIDDRIRQEYFALQKDIFELSLDVKRNQSEQQGALASLFEAETFKARTLFETLSQRDADLKLGNKASNKISFDFLSSSFEAAKSPLKNTLSYPKPSKSNLQAHQQRLNPGEATLYFFMGKEQSYLWYIDSNTIESHTLPNNKTITAETTSLLNLIRENPAVANNRRHWANLVQASKALSKSLLTPISEHLVSVKSLLIIPDESLHRLPFAVLLSPASDYTKPLVETTSISYANSIAMAEHLKQHPNTQSTNKGLLMVANPNSADNTASNLYAAQSEANQLIKLWGQHNNSKLLSGALATKNTLLETPLNEYEVIHFASHAYVDWDNPLDSAIELAHHQDNASANPDLTITDIAALDLNAELVVLSACETASGRLTIGEGPIGLSRAFFEAGANRVLASLWPVEDQATAKLLELYYEGLLTLSLDPREALKHAQKVMMKNQFYAHPYYWSGFVFIGNNSAWLNLSSAKLDNKGREKTPKGHLASRHIH